MSPSVLNYEPHSALFVPDADPLVFYRRIGELCVSGLLTNGGHLFFEINEALGNETVDLLRSLGFENIELRKDFDERDRMIHAVR